MDIEGHRQVSAVAEELGYEVTPIPASAENVKYFDIISEGAAIVPNRLMNAIHNAVGKGIDDVTPSWVSTQSHCVTFEDLSIRLSSEPYIR